MQIDAILNPAEIALLPARDLTGTTCVVFDVLRATSSMITALEHGAAEIHAVCTIEKALALRAQLPGALLGGERHGDLIPGFDLGNSPLEYCGAVAGRTIITTTTNGTVALRACGGAARVLIGALLNLDALAAELCRSTPERVALICAGTFETFALEDAYAAGLLIAELADAELTDAAQAAVRLARSFADPLAALLAARNGRVLLAADRAAEVEWCARKSQFNVVAQMDATGIRRLTA